MTTLAFNSILTYRVHADYRFLGRVLCEFLQHHDWTKWAPVSNDVKSKTVSQARECTRCGFTERKPL